MEMKVYQNLNNGSHDDFVGINQIKRKYEYKDIFEKYDQEMILTPSKVTSTVEENVIMS